MEILFTTGLFIDVSDISLCQGEQVHVIHFYAVEPFPIGSNGSTGKYKFKRCPF